jgi:hypothetical protein
MGVESKAHLWLRETWDTLHKARVGDSHKVVVEKNRVPSWPAEKLKQQGAQAMKGRVVGDFAIPSVEWVPSLEGYNGNRSPSPWFGRMLSLQELNLRYICLIPCQNERSGPRPSKRWNSHSFIPPLGKWTVGWYWKVLRITSGKCILVSYGRLMPAELKTPSLGLLNQVISTVSSSDREVKC